MKLAYVLTLPLLVGSSHAATLFADNFNRADSRNIDGSISGITNNTGTGMAADGVYTHGFIDPLNSDVGGNLAPDGSATDGGGAQILSSTLELADGAGTSNAYINHNFINGEILSAGGFQVTVDITGLTQSGAGQGGGFAIGMTQADADNAGDAISDTTKFQDAFHGDPFNEVTDVSISSFFLVLRGNGRLVWGGAGNYVTGNTNVGIGLANLPGFPNTGTISAVFTNFSDFDAGTSFDYEVFHDGTSYGSGTLAWQTDDSNYIGLDARDSGGVFFDNLEISTIPEPAAAVLGGLGLLGLLRRRR